MDLLYLSFLIPQKLWGGFVNDTDALKSNSNKGSVGYFFASVLRAFVNSYGN